MGLLLLPLLYFVFFDKSILILLEYNRKVQYRVLDRKN